jgi:hypothetical protein
MVTHATRARSGEAYAAANTSQIGLSQAGFGPAEEAMRVRTIPFGSILSAVGVLPDYKHDRVVKGCMARIGSAQGYDFPRLSKETAAIVKHLAKRLGVEEEVNQGLELLEQSHGSRDRLDFDSKWRRDLQDEYKALVQTLRDRVTPGNSRTLGRLVAAMDIHVTALHYAANMGFIDYAWGSPRFEALKKQIGAAFS